MELTKATSDGYHTLGELYDHRTILFACLCNQNWPYAWKSSVHEDGTMYDGFFIAGMILPGAGEVAYHCEEKFWPLFHCDELPAAPHFTGYSPDDVLKRLETFFCRS